MNDGLEHQMDSGTERAEAGIPVRAEGHVGVLESLPAEGPMTEVEPMTAMAPIPAPSRNSWQTREEYQREVQRNERLRTIAENFAYFGFLSLLFGVVKTFLLYRNPAGITFPVFVAFAYGMAVMISKRMKVPVKTGSLLIMGASLLLGVSTCLTGSGMLNVMNRAAIFMLFCVFILHQCYNDRAWNIGKYVGSILMYLLQALVFVWCPFSHASHFLKSIKSKKYKNVVWVAAGLGAAVPMVILLAILLASADMVFQSMLDDIIEQFLNPFTVFTVVIETAAAALCMYCMVCSAFAREIPEESRSLRNGEPILAISFMGMIGLVYLVFCAIQVMYLFLGKGTLPEGMTYADYARQGFFQLLFVAMLNLVMVLMCLKYFRGNVILNGVLLTISICTYVMIASAAYRMVLYVQQYQLTRLRVLVLWFLAMMVVLMAGVVILIFKNQFPLFRYCLTIVTVFYIVLAFARPDYQIARYNLANGDRNAQTQEGYLGLLSVDAAPAVASMVEDQEVKKQLLRGYRNGYELWAGDGLSIRGFNFSYAAAQNELNLYSGY